MNIRQEVTLYLNGQQVDLNDNGGIYFNYKQKDVKNPTVVKNSFSKTVTIPGTDNNDVIFNNIWNLTRVQTTSQVPYFNQSKRVPFELFLNGELIEQGYCKLDRIRRDKVNEYDLSLFGGLGDFFYSLAYDASNGVKKTLASLDYGEDLSFIINKETVKANWDELASGQTPTIAFAPMYNGIPDAIDAGKTLINTSGYTGMTRYDKGDGWYEMPGFMTSYNFDEYKTIDRYALAEGVELDEWQARDLRSWCQRPVLHIPALFDAICNPDNNGGYEVVLDPDFFSSGNNYYREAYITLPLINELDLNKTVSTSSATINVLGVSGDTTTTDYAYLEVSGSTGTTTNVIIRLNMSSELSSPSAFTSAYNINSFGDNSIGGIGVQLVGLDNNGIEVAGGNIAWLTSTIVGSSYTTFDTAVSAPLSNPFRFYDKVDTYVGCFLKDSAETGFNKYYWDTNLDLTMSTNVVISEYRIKAIYIQRTYFATSFKGFLWPNRDMQQQSGGKVMVLNAPDIINASTEKSEPTINFSNIEVSQDSLLNTEYTPADYLLSYCKLFNLYFDRDVTNKTIKILTSKNFYDKDVDLTDDIDREIEIEPLSFEHKWYSFNYAAGNGPLVKNYKAKYGVDFGSQRVNTGYEFDSDTEELLTSNVFKNAVDYLPSNKYFVQVKDENNVELPIFLLNNVTYHLYNDDGDPNDVTVGISRKGSYSSINPKSTETIQYDSFNKVQFCDGNKPVDGANVLLFFNGIKTVPVNYWITDDLGYMFQLNDKATWLWTAIENDASGNQIAIKTNSLPQFSRYIMDDEYIYASWDFGRTRELYIPEISYVDGDATIYERYWRAYIQDLYDIDTRIVTGYIQFDEKPTKESLKHFYYFEGSYWVIDEIIDYNPTSYELTKVKFVKVNDKNNYLNNNIVPPGPGPEPVVKVFGFTPDGRNVTSGAGTASTTLHITGYDLVEFFGLTGNWYTVTTAATEVGYSLTITYDQNNTSSVRSAPIGAVGRDQDTQETVYAYFNFMQAAAEVPDTVSITAPSPIAATATSLSYSVSATKPVTVKILPQDTTNTHGTGTSLGSFSIPANTAATAEYYSLLAWLTDYPSITAATSVIQDGVSVYVTGISLSSTWATDVPYTGGTATYQNCNNVVTAYYSDGTSADITSQASFTASTSLNVPATTSTTRDSVGVISVIASYYDGSNPFTSTVVVTAYQEAAGTPPTPTVTWQAYNRSEWNVYGNIHTGSTQDYAGLEVLTGETEDHNEAVPVTLTSAYLALSPAPQNPENYSIVLSNSTYGDAMTCTFDSVNNAWVGTGSVRLEQGTVLDIAVVQINSRGTVQEEPEPDETEEEPEE